ncbi:Multidrug resistance protein MdtH [bacterium HR17]|uniref:Multidrug resistance protein MdtH n=1 Tax=Candidatus Fervidibacter japonicus TaxID=2035412 RepID=A0A2H5X959_9BACT|nr:Multidrug resistance protein MdtH [bacterium HR17]
MAAATRQRLPKTVVTLGIVSLLNDASSEMIYPLLPFFLREQLKASVAFVGLVEGVAETTASLLKLFSGWLADRVGHHKALTVCGYAVAGLTRPLMAAATAAWQVLALRFIDRFGKGIRTAPRDALLANASDASVRGYAFGFHRAMDHLGAVVGPLLASGVLLCAPGNYRLAFALAAVPALMALAVLWWGVREATTPPSRAALRLGDVLAWRTFDPRLRWYLLAVGLFTLSNSSDAFLLLRAKACGVAESAIPLLWTWLHIVKSGTATLGGRLSDRIGRVRAIALGWFIYAVVYAGFAFANTAWQVWALFTVYGLYFGLTEGAERALVADLSAPDQRGRGYGAFHFVVGVGMLPASVLFGVLWQQWGAKVAFLFGAALALTAMGVLKASVARR